MKVESRERERGVEEIEKKEKTNTNHIKEKIQIKFMSKLVA